ncbi:AI-2E family transporter [Trueperella bialowiezensis]|uniref:Pheromone autoinducer 2 transporter n=1 Tax=Trueperella bialowiezensis TaxID=312285 RepID=A0A3S4UYL9_9ACTO|nr:AI-2E family transporter [Trueperella bialowiezensis]VEI13057.1 pheromone autoinducer 2 transporter [Trueperella bialowiezensis]
MGIFARFRRSTTRDDDALLAKRQAERDREKAGIRRITTADVEAIAQDKERGTWGGMVAPPNARVHALGIPHWLAKYGLGAWMLIGMAIALIGITTALSAVTEVFLAVFLGFVLTSVLHPMVDWLSRYMPRALSTALALVFGFLVFGGMLTYVVYSVANEWNALAGQFEEGVESILAFLTDGPLPIELTREEINSAVSNAVQAGTQWVQSNAGTIASTVATNAGQFAVIVTVLALALFIAAVLLAQGPKMWLWVLNLLPARNRERFNLGAFAAWTAFSGYSRGTVIISLINGVLSFIFLTIVGVPLAAPLAVLVLIGTFIPLVGAPAAMVVAMVVALASGGIVDCLIVGAGIAIIGQLEGDLFQPLVMGKQVSLHPVVIAVGVAAGGFAGGLIGAVITIPIMAICWAVFRTLNEPEEPLTEIPYVPKERVLPEDD